MSRQRPTAAGAGCEQGAPQDRTTETWTIASLVPGGDGLARLTDGRIGFAANALPGDRIRPTELRRHRSYLRATAWKLVEPGPERVQPVCSVADRCGGCDWMRLARPAQLRWKVQVLGEALRRTGGFHELPDRIELVTAGGDVGYRARLRLHIDASGRIGLYARGSHELVEIPTCVVAAPRLQQGLAQLRSMAVGHLEELAEFSEAELRAAPDESDLLLRLWPRERKRRGGISDAARAWVQRLHSELDVTIAGEPSEGRAEQRWPLPGHLQLIVPGRAFSQVNWAVNGELVRRVVDGARERSIDSFCDLYCGAGNFTLPLLAAGLAGVGVDRERSGVEAAVRAAGEQGLPPDAFIACDVRRQLGRWVRGGRRFDWVLLDPPRSGARATLGDVIRLAPRWVAICSCDPVTLARDLRTLAQAGYTLQQIVAFDMFPHTHHLEALAWMRRDAGGGGRP